MPEKLLDAPLTDKEWVFLRCGLHEWEGPAHCTEEFARAMGFGNVEGLIEEGRRLRAHLGRHEPLSWPDWKRALLATEIVFASDVVGSGCDWQSTTGFSDEESIQLLRSIQRKLMKAMA